MTSCSGTQPLQVRGGARHIGRDFSNPEKLRIWNHGSQGLERTSSYDFLILVYSPAKSGSPGKPVQMKCGYSLPPTADQGMGDLGMCKFNKCPRSVGFLAPLISGGKSFRDKMPGDTQVSLNL